jgi:hypothetical protein
MAWPLLHSVAHMAPGEHWANAEPVASPSRQTTAKVARPNDFQCDISPSPSLRAKYAPIGHRRHTLMALLCAVNYTTS